MINIFDIDTNYDCWHNFKIGDFVIHGKWHYTIISLYKNRRKFVIKGFFSAHDKTLVVSGDELINASIIQRRV